MMKVKRNIPWTQTYLIDSLSALLYCLTRQKVKMSPVKLTMPLLFAGHGDGALRTDERADSAAFAEIVIDFNVAGLLVSGDAKIRAKIAAQVTTAAGIIAKAPARLHDRCLLVKTRFDVVEFFGVLLFVSAPDFQFTGFSHPDFLGLTTELCGESFIFFFQIPVYGLGGSFAAGHGFHHRAWPGDKVPCSEHPIHIGLQRLSINP
jgi:hypothetical protein